MSLNITKTKSLLITTLQEHRILTSSELNVQIDGRSIEHVDYAKMLGVMTYQVGSIISIQSAASLAVCFLFSVASNLILTSALRFYNSCVNNYFISFSFFLFIYWSAAWGNRSHHLLLRLLRLQNRAGCILIDADLSQTSISLFLKLSWIPVFDLIKYRKLFLLFIVLLILIRMLLNVSGTSFNFFVTRMDLWALLQELLSMI